MVSGEHTHSGHPILVYDPHLDSNLPGEWYPIRIRYTFNQTGTKRLSIASVPGIPIFTGKLPYFSFSLTIKYSDTQDLFQETISQDNSQYWYNSNWRDLRLRK